MASIFLRKSSKVIVSKKTNDRLDSTLRQENLHQIVQTQMSESLTTTVLKLLTI